MQPLLDKWGSSKDTKAVHGEEESGDGGEESGEEDDVSGGEGGEAEMEEDDSSSDESLAGMEELKKQYRSGLFNIYVIVKDFYVISIFFFLIQNASCSLS